MPELNVFCQQFEKRFVGWASANPDIRAAIVVGSRARRDNPADEWSDLDILLFAQNVNRYQDQQDWIEALAPTWMVLQSRTVMNDPEQVVLFAGGFRTDFVFHTADVLSGVKDMVENNQVPAVIARGARVLIDKDHAIPKLPAPTRPGPAQPPSQADFQKAVEKFWFQAVFAAYQLRRGEMVPFKAVDIGLKWQLISLLEWNVHSLKGGAVDTWHAGRFLSEWLDPGDLAEFSASYAPCNREESWTAFNILLDLYQRKALETARQLGYPERSVWMGEIRSYLYKVFEER